MLCIPNPMNKSLRYLLKKRKEIVCPFYKKNKYR